MSDVCPRAAGFVPYYLNQTPEEWADGHAAGWTAGMAGVGAPDMVGLSTRAVLASSWLWGYFYGWHAAQAWRAAEEAFATTHVGTEPDAAIGQAERVGAEPPKV